jgi:hypothetical protein
MISAPKNHCESETYPSNQLIYLTLHHFYTNFNIMQCSRCDYIRFKSAPKCVNCGFDFKNEKSTHEVPGESENEFTIFAAAGTQAVAVSAASSPEMNFQEQLSSEELVDPHEEAPSDEYDSSLETQETFIQESGDFELDLSGMDIEDSEDWVVGATLTEDLAEISNFGGEDPSENLTQESQEPNEFAVQGLGFDATEDIEPANTEIAPPESNSSLDSELTILDEEMAVQEMEPYASKSEIKFVPENEDPALIESSIEELVEEIDPSQSLEAPSDDSGDISLETELELETIDSEFNLDQEDTKPDETSETSLDIQDNSIELDPMLELEDLDLALEIENPETETAPQATPQTSEITLEDQDLIEGAGDDDAPLLPEDNPKQD